MEKKDKLMNIFLTYPRQTVSDVSVRRYGEFENDLQHSSGKISSKKKINKMIK